MEVSEVSINQIFLGNQVLRIPFFQRGYVWNESNWKQFFEDLVHVTVLNPTMEKPEVYFMGSIIMKRKSPTSQEYDIIDGQQRLSTIVMFMKALCLTMNRDDLFSQNFMQTSLSDQRNPVLVPNYNDRNVYNEIINFKEIDYNRMDASNRLMEAFKYFVDRIAQLKNSSEDGIRVTPEELYMSVINNVRLICLKVQDGENAQKIFETINCTGIRLTTGEMLKNYLFDETKIEEYERSWKVVFENMNRKYWDSDMLSGRTSESHIENFFYRYMLIKMQDPEIREGLSQGEMKVYRQKGGQFEKFRNLMIRFGISKDEAIADIVSYARIYMEIFKKDTLDEVAVQYPGIERLVYLMFLQGAWTMTPYILYLLKNADRSECNRIFAYMETYLVRRIICKSKNNNYSDMFSENLIGQKVCTFDAFKAYVNDEDNRGALLMPSDEDVVEAVNTKDLKLDAYTILYLMESRLNAGFVKATCDNSANGFVKEQVMPEKDNGNWPSAEGFDEEQRQMLTRTLGNFAILRGKVKSKYKGGPWRMKRDVMKPLSEGVEIEGVFRNGLATWDESTIVERNHWLADKVLEIWAI